MGFWEQQVLRCFIVPRGTAMTTATSFMLVAEAGSDTYGIYSNRFLDKEFKTVRYELTVTVLDAKRFHYKVRFATSYAGRPDLFHHTDENTLTRVMA